MCLPLSWIEILVDWFDKTIEFVEQGDGEELSIFFANQVKTLLKEYVKLYMMLASLILVKKLVVQNFSNIS